MSYLQLVLIALGFMSFSLRGDTFKIVDIRANALFAPVGFDDNDEVVVVLDCYLPSTCYRLVKPFVNADSTSGKITISARARKFEGICADVTVPFTQEVSLGQLNEGKFRVATKDGKLSADIEIKKGQNPGPDDYLYAPVEFAHVTYPGGLRWSAILEGRFTNSCLKIEETKVFLTGKTIQVLPIMRLQTEREAGYACRPEERSFRTAVELPLLKDEGRYLLHVRSLKGDSINEVFYRTPHNP